MTGGERVLVVKSERLGGFTQPGGVKVSPGDGAEFFDIVDRHGQYMDRSHAETDTAYRQVIPYALVTWEDQIFMTQRTKKQSETRLHGMYSLGIGGHINETDADAKGNAVMAGMLRELDEEVFIDLNDIRETRCAAVIADDTSEVGRVHIGVLFRIVLSAKNCAVKETDKMEGGWVPVSEAKNLRERMETWSQLAIDYIL